MSFAVDIQALHKWYGTDKHALRGIDLRISSGEFIALLGPNGAGKSTTLGILSALIKKSQGSVALFGHDIDQRPALAKQSLGVMPQEYNFNIFETLYDTLIYQAGYHGISRRQAAPEAKRLLTQMHLWDRRDHQVVSLSGGLKRKLMVARALINRPKLLILDEPTANIDIENRNQLWDIFSALHRDGMTVILTTHHLEEAQALCQRIAIILHGKLQIDQSLETLLRDNQDEVYTLHLQTPCTSLPESPPGTTVQAVDHQKLKLVLPSNQTLSTLLPPLLQSLDICRIENKKNHLESIYIRLLEQHNQSAL